MEIRGWAARSAIHGFGLFARKAISAGAVFNLVPYRFHGMEGSLNSLVDGNIACVPGKRISVYVAMRNIIPGEELTLREPEEWMRRHIASPLLFSWQATSNNP